MYINRSLKYHRFAGTQSRIISKVHDLLGQPLYMYSEKFVVISFVFSLVDVWFYAICNASV